MRKVLISILSGLIEDIENDRYKLSDSDIESLTEALSTVFNSELPMSKYQAQRYLNISRATFDNLIRQGEIPKGHHRMGFKELEWRKSDIDKYLSNVSKDRNQ